MRRTGSTTADPQLNRLREWGCRCGDFDAGGKCECRSQPGRVVRAAQGKEGWYEPSSGARRRARRRVLGQRTAEARAGRRGGRGRLSARQRPEVLRGGAR